MVQPVSYKRYFRCNNRVPLPVYAINPSPSTDLVDPYGENTFSVKPPLAKSFCVIFHFNSSKVEYKKSVKLVLKQAQIFWKSILEKFWCFFLFFWLWWYWKIVIEMLRLWGENWIFEIGIPRKVWFFKSLKLY